MHEKGEKPDCVVHFPLEVSGYQELLVLLGGLGAEFSCERDQEMLADHLVVHELRRDDFLDELCCEAHVFSKEVMNPTQLLCCLQIHTSFRSVFALDFVLDVAIEAVPEFSLLEDSKRSQRPQEVVLCESFVLKAFLHDSLGDIDQETDFLNLLVENEFFFGD